MVKKYIRQVLTLPAAQMVVAVVELAYLPAGAPEQEVLEPAEGAYVPAEQTC